MQVNEVQDWQHSWWEIAKQEGGVVWDRLLRVWAKHQRQRLYQLTWQQKHHPAAMAAKQKAAEDRAFRFTGGTPVGGGRYKCPHCYEPAVCQKLRSFKNHVEQCRALSEDVRRRQAAQRPETRTGLVGLKLLASRRLLCRALRVLNVTFRPSSRPMRKPRLPSELLLRQRRFLRTHRRTRVRQCGESRSASGLTTGTRQRFAWPTSADSLCVRCRLPTLPLPTPAIPEGHDTKVCIFCSKVFPSGAECGRHSLACTWFPEWIRRIRICQYDYKDSDITCPHTVELALLLRRPGVGTRCARNVEKRLVSV